MFYQENPTCLRIWSKLSVFFTLILFFGCVCGALVYGSVIAKSLKVFDVSQAQEKWVGAKTLDKIIWTAFAGCWFLYIVTLFWDCILYLRRAASPLNKALKSLLFESCVTQLKKSITLARLVIVFQSIGMIGCIAWGILMIPRVDLGGNNHWSSKISSALKTVSKAFYSDIYGQLWLIGLVFILAVAGLITKFLFHRSMSETLCLYKDKNVGWFFREQKRLTCIWNWTWGIFVIICILLFGALVTVFTKKPEWLEWTKKIADFAEMKTGEKQLSKPFAITALTGSGLTLILFLINNISNIMKGLKTVNGVLRKGIKSVCDLQHCNSIRTNMMIVEGLQILATVLLLGFLGSLVCHIQGINVLSKISTKITDSHNQWTMIGVAGLVLLLTVIIIIGQYIVRKEYKTFENREYYRDVKLGMVSVGK